MLFLVPPRTYRNTFRHATRLTTRLGGLTLRVFLLLPQEYPDRSGIPFGLASVSHLPGAVPFYLGGSGTFIRNATAAAWVTLLDSALRAAVPLFVLASSYLLLPLKYDTSTFFRKRFVRVCIPLLIWSVLYALFPYWGSAEGFDRGANLQRLLLNFNPHSGHLWFLYMLLGLYLIMPVLSPWLSKVSRKGEEAFLWVWGFTTLIPFLRQAALSLTFTVCAVVSRLLSFIPGSKYVLG